MRTGGWKRMAVACALGTVTLLSGGTAQAFGVGEKAPTFSLPATTAKQVSNTDFPGRTLLLFFYVGAFTNS